jgi:hypothetical protein
MSRLNRITRRVTLCASLAIVAAMATAAPLKLAVAGNNWDNGQWRSGNNGDWNNGQWRNGQHSDRNWDGSGYGTGYGNGYGNGYGTRYGAGSYYSYPAPTYYYVPQPTYYYQPVPTYYQPRPVYQQPGINLDFNIPWSSYR